MNTAEQHEVIIITHLHSQTCSDYKYLSTPSVHWKTIEVTYDEKGSAVETPCDPEPEGVAYDRFVPHLLNLIKRQKEQIEAMEARLSALETK